MSDLTTRMNAKSGGHSASSASLRALFAPEGTGTGGATSRQPSSSPGMETRPNLG